MVPYRLFKQTRTVGDQKLAFGMKRICEEIVKYSNIIAGNKTGIGIESRRNILKESVVLNSA